MAIERVDPELCVGCGTCVISCPADVIGTRKDSGKAFARYPEDCVLCCWCLGECPAGAIVFTAGKRERPFTSWG